MYAVRPEICGSHFAPEKFRVCAFVICACVLLLSGSECFDIDFFVEILLLLLFFVACARWRIYDRSKGYKEHHCFNVSYIMAISHLLS